MVRVLHLNYILSLILLYYSEAAPKHQCEHATNATKQYQNWKKRENNSECAVVESLYDEIYEDMIEVERAPSVSPLPPLQLSRNDSNHYMRQKWKQQQNDRECLVVETICEEIFDDMFEVERSSSDSPKSEDNKRRKSTFDLCIDDSLLIQLQNEKNDEKDGFVPLDDGYVVSMEYSPEFSSNPRDWHKSRRFDPVYYEDDECRVI